jgi:DNA polymerase III delta prime subunit
MTYDQDIVDALKAALPEKFHQEIPVLAQILTAARDGTPGSVATENLQSALIALQGKTIHVQSGNITVGNVSGKCIAIGHGATVTNISIYKPPTPDEKQAWRNRNHMLEKVRTHWIEGFLKPSLQQFALIDLSMHFYPGALEHSWERFVQFPDCRHTFVSPDTSIARVFDAAGGELLILGSPGTGKTTMLLELARTLIVRAQQNEIHAIPIIFNLASWAERRQPLDHWLVEELKTHYGIKPKLGRAWIAENQILLLLDGLDEVRPGYRDDCVKAINSFCEKHGPVKLVVCSRIADYTELTRKLHLQGAIVLQPLTEKQMATALQQMGDTAEKVRRVLRQLQNSADHANDVEAQKLTCTPLLLNITTLAYQGNTESELPPPDATPAEQQRHLFATYVERMFERRGKHKKYKPEETKHWLAWLAGRMQTYDISIFNFKSVQPWWLEKGWQQISFYTSMVIVFGLIGALAGIIIFGLPGIVIGSLTLGLTFGLFRELDRQRLILTDLPASDESLPWVIKELYQIRSVAGRGLLFGSITGLSGGLAIGLVSGMFLTFPQLIWQTGLGLLLGLIFGVWVGIGYAFILGIVDYNRGKRIFAPGEKWWLIRSAASLGIAGGVLAGIVFPSLAGAVGGLFLGLSGGMAGTLSNARHTPIRQVILWGILCLDNRIPWNYTAFLNYATERIFLRKTGNGYTFLHKELEKYFATLEKEYLDFGK